MEFATDLRCHRLQSRRFLMWRRGGGAGGGGLEGQKTGKKIGGGGKLRLYFCILAPPTKNISFLN